MDGDEGSGSSDRASAGGVRRGSSAASDHTDDGSNGKSRKSSDHRGSGSGGGQFIHPEPIDQQLIDASIDSVVFKKDAWVYAQDPKNDWYVARMYAVRETSNGQQIKVHYRGWNTRYDAFLPTSRLKVYNGPILDAEKDAETFAVGDFVGARWGGKTFPAKILKFVTVDGEESARVLFDDGFEKAVRIKTISKLPSAQLAKIDQATFGRQLVLKVEKTSLDDEKQMQEMAHSNERVKRKSAGTTLKRLTEAMMSHRSSGSSTKKSRPSNQSQSQSIEQSKNRPPESTDDDVLVDDVGPVESLPDCIPQISESPADIDRDKKIEAQFSVPRGPTTADDRCARVRRFNFDDDRTGNLNNLPSDVVVPPALSTALKQSAATSARKRKASGSPAAASSTPAKLTALGTEQAASQSPTATRPSATRRLRGGQIETKPVDSEGKTAKLKSPEKDGGQESKTAKEEEMAPSPSAASGRPTTARRRSQGSRLLSSEKKTVPEFGAESEPVSKSLLEADSERYSTASERTASTSSPPFAANPTVSSSSSTIAARRSVRPRKQTTKAAESFEVVSRRRSRMSSPFGASADDSPSPTVMLKLKLTGASEGIEAATPSEEQTLGQKSPMEIEPKTPLTPSSQKKAPLSPAKTARQTPLKSPKSPTKSPKSSKNEAPLSSPSVHASSTAVDQQSPLPSSPKASPVPSDPQKLVTSPSSSSSKKSPTGTPLTSSALQSSSPNKHPLLQSDQRALVDSAARSSSDLTAESMAASQQRSIADELLDDWNERPRPANIIDSTGERVGTAAAEGMEKEAMMIGAMDDTLEKRQTAIGERAISRTSINRSPSRLLQQSETLDANWLNEFSWLRCEDGIVYCAVCTLFNETKQEADEFTEGFVAQRCSLEGIQVHNASVEHKLAETAQEMASNATSAGDSVADSGKVVKLKQRMSVGQPILRLKDIKKDSVSSSDSATPSEKSQKPPTKKWQTSEKERGRVMRKVNEIMVGREDFLVVDGDFAYCKVCRHFATEGGSKGNQWVRGAPIGSVATVVAHENTAPHRKKIALYYAQVLKMPMPAAGGRLSVKHEIRCSHEGCEKTFRSLDMMGAHVRHSHQPKDADGMPMTPVVAVKTPTPSTRPALVGRARQLIASSKKTKSPKKIYRKSGQPPAKKPRRIIMSSDSSDSDSSDNEDRAEANAFDSDDYEPEREEKVSSDDAMSSSDENQEVDVDGEEEEDDEDRTDTGSEGDQERSRSSVSELGSEDVIRCQCQDNVENGFMLQCDRCKTWQHGDCVGIGKQHTPDLYTCYVCIDPPKIRTSRRYAEKVREEYLRDGLLPSFGLTPAAGDANGPAPMPSRAPIMIRTHTLKSRALEMHDRLRAIKVRMRVGCDPSYLAGLPPDTRTEAALKTQITEMQDEVEERLIELATEIGAAEKFWYTKFSSIGERESSAGMSKSLLDLTKDLKKIKKMALLSR